jgi:hypothetical protein
MRPEVGPLQVLRMFLCHMVNEMTPSSRKRYLRVSLQVRVLLQAYYFPTLPLYSPTPLHTHDSRWN